MKLRNLFFAALSVFAFAACNDTPESPYNPGGGNENGGTTANGFAYIDETFESSLGAFTTQQEVGNFAWKHEVYNEKAYAKVSGYANGASQNAISWLISPSFNLSNETKAYVSFEYVINKGEASAAATNHKLMVTSEYTGDATTTQWTEVDYEAVNNGSWSFQKTGNVSLPIDFIGAENVVIAFKYISTTETSSTWEVKNILVTGEVGATEEYNPEINKPSIDGENLLANGDFEIWEDGKPANWGLTVTNGTYSQSSDANSGAASVLIEGASTNKRLASKSYTLKAGTYTLAAYFKSTGDAVGQYRLGYAKLTDGVVADTQNDYIYITSAAQVPSAWGQSYESFTLEAETEIAVIIMNSKNGSGASILVDDVTLTTTNGGIADGTGSQEPETPEMPAGAYISEAFTNGFGSFTTQETIGDFAWVSDAQYGAKASGYANGASQDAESWLISSAIDFTNETAAYIAFDYVINKGDASAAAANHKLLITNNYTG
ncbi:MAG: choice-of-anchor J domain-containing protein, partial [Bacteroidaceae bacterium]|nr:choice-of-anchor J domain-containing protein [Bacteroidaceae bacterium]